MSRIILVVSTLFSVLMLSACSMLSVGYKQSPTLAYLWLDSYFDFNESQTQRLKADLAQLKDWHSRQELPVYYKLLQQIQSQSKQDLQAEQVCSVFTQARQSLLRFADRASPTVLEVAAQVTPEQIKFWTKKLDKRNQKWREEWLDLSAANLQKKRFEKQLSFAEDFYGDLSTAQENLLRERMATSTFNAPLAYQEGLRQQQEGQIALRRIVQEKPNPEQIKLIMNGLFDRILNSPNPAYVSYFAALTEENCQTISLLHNSSSPKQRAYLQKVLAGYAKDILSITQSL
jgi:Family of unknown function (DUF6279)